jgi:hypothetical protein
MLQHAYTLAVVVVAVTGLPGVLAAQELKPNAAAYLQRCEDHSAAFIADLRADVAELQDLRGELARKLVQCRSGTINRRITESTIGPDGRGVFPSTQAKQAAIKKAEASLATADKGIADSRRKVEASVADISHGKAIVPAPLPFNYKVGDIGAFGCSVMVTQIIDDQNMVVRGLLNEAIAEAIAKAGIRDDDTDIRVALDLVAMVRGKPTAGLSISAIIDLEHTVLEVTGKTTYTTPAGDAKTILVLEPFDLEPIKLALKQRRGR